MINKKSSLTAIGLVMACSLLITSSTDAQTRIQPTNPTPTQTPIQEQARMARAVVNPGNAQDQGVIIFLKAILENESRLGRNPGNSQLLAEIQQLADRNSVQTKSVVKVINKGAGQLKTISSDGSGWLLLSGQSIDLDVGSDPINLEAEQQNVLVELQHIRNVPCQFWDQDDQRHYPIGPGSKHQATLTPGVRGHHLEQ
jgi:hypothetical protein